MHCKGCLAHTLGGPAKGHSEECRARIEAAMGATTSGGHKLEEAERRLHRASPGSLGSENRTVVQAEAAVEGGDAAEDSPRGVKRQAEETPEAVEAKRQVMEEAAPETSSGSRGMDEVPEASGSSSSSSSSSSSDSSSDSGMEIDSVEIKCMSAILGLEGSIDANGCLGRTVAIAELMSSGTFGGLSYDL